MTINSLIGNNNIVNINTLIFVQSYIINLIQLLVAICIYLANLYKRVCVTITIAFCLVNQNRCGPLFNGIYTK